MRWAARRRAPRSHADRGSVTVEFALALPTLVVVLALALSAAAWAIEMQGAQRAAGEAARAAVVDSDAEAVAVALAALGARHDPAVTLRRAGGYVTVCVEVARSPWPTTTRCAIARDRP